MHARAHDAAHLETIVTTTLDAMGWGGLYDEEEGGFFRCSTSRDWRQPLREKTLEVNAQLLRVYADAAGAFGIGRFGERAADVLRYVERALADPDGGWYGSQRSIDGGVDRTLYADANALMASAVLRAAALFDAESLRRDAVRSLERVLLACYRPGQGVAHYFDGRAHVRGLLADQIAMAAAQLDAHDATGDVVYEMMAEELAHYADPSDVGLMRVRLKPFVWNCEAARAFRRLAVASGAAEFARRADAALSAVAPAARAQGPLAAHYVLALEQAG
jgi:uncharacterized protein YyaL (SSP411 family)